MNVIIIILILILVASIIGNLVKTNNKNTNDGQELPKRNLLAMWCTYIGGCPKILDTHITNVSIEKDENNLYFNNLTGDILSIPLSNIKDITVQSKEQISQRVTISRLILLGVFAFGAPKKEKKITKYIVINYSNDKSEDEDIILEHKQAPIVAEKLHKAIFETSQGEPKIICQNANVNNLIKCPMCGKMISPNAEVCPNCGEPIKRNNKNYGDVEMNLKDLKKQADEEEKQNKEIENLRFKICKLNIDYENDLEKYSSLANEKIKKNIKKEFQDYFEKEDFHVKESDMIGIDELYAEYKSVKIKLEKGIDENVFQISCENEKIYESYKIEVIENDNNNFNSESWKLFNKYKENVYNIKTKNDAEKLIDYLNNEIQDIKNKIDSVNNGKFRYKSIKHDIYFNSIHDILENIFNK